MLEVAQEVKVPAYQTLSSNPSAEKTKKRKEKTFKKYGLILEDLSDISENTQNKVRR
jgi:hypothetical protein